MNAFQCEKQGANTYMVYEISKEEEVDSLSLGMLLNNKIRGLAPVIYGQMDEVQCLRYNISSKTSLSQYLTGILSRERILKIFRSVTETILEAEEYMIEPSSVLLDPEHVFVDSQTGETAVICLPLMDMEGTDVSTFFKNIMFSSNAIFDSKENCDYVARIINHLNRAETFSLVNFRDLLMELERETQGMQGGTANVVQGAGVVSGVVGNNAVSGTQGAVGRNGTPGTVGRNGMPGTAGMQGAVGRNGMPGTTGVPRASGVGDIPGTQNTSGAWGASVGQNIQGMQGTPKVNGAIGVENTNNMPGVSGMQGVNTRPQAQAANGMSGLNGALGARGVGGMAGKNGGIGAHGISPVRRISTVQPMSGAQGSLGMRGTSGMPGTPGTGAQGSQSQPVGFEIPGAAAAEPAMEKEKKKWSLFGSKSNQEEKNKKTEDKKKSSKKEQGGKKSGGIFGNVFGGKNPNMEGTGNAGSGYPYGGNMPYNPDETSIAMDGDEVTTLLDNEPRLVRERNQEIIFLQKDVFRIGRKREVVDYCIEGNPTIGRCHAVIVKKGDAFYIVDAGSKNHTYVNGMMIESNVEVPLENQAVIKLSDEGFVFEMG